jgi:hypothetical protein
MRLWTLHPKYLDPQGLVALWREGLLARAVLRRQTMGYRRHPQLLRFESHRAPRTAINAYLAGVLLEAEGRGYSFDATRIGPVRETVILTATAGQLTYEWEHLLNKLAKRNPDLHRRWVRTRAPEPHPLFRVIAGGVAPWERRSVSPR